MLRKLVKHEWCSTWKIPTALCIFMVLMTLIGAFSFRMPLWQKLLTDSFSFTIFDLLAVVILITYFISIIVCSYAIMIYFAVRFYKNLYTDEGYLTFTLPTTPRKLLLSKTLVSTFWVLFSSLLLLTSVCALIYIFIRALSGESQWAEFTAISSEIMPVLETVFAQYGHISPLGFLLLFLLIIVAGSFSGILLIYLCISIGQLFRRHRVAASIIAYLVALTLIQTISSVVSLPVTFRMIMDMEQTTNNLSSMELVFSPLASMVPIYYIAVIFSILESVVCFFACEYIAKRKLNLE